MNDTINSRPFQNKYYRHVLYALIFPLYMVSFFILEKIIYNGYPVLFHSYLPIDSLIPFCPQFSVFYVLWYPMLGAFGFYMLFCDAEGFKRYMTYIGVTFFTMIVFCAVFPNDQLLRPEITGKESVFTAIMKWVYTNDTYTNVLPSAHVFGGMAMIFACFDRKSLNKTWLKVITTVLSTLICISTVFVKQHSLLDVIVAVPLGILWYFIVYKVIFRKNNIGSVRQSAQK